MWIAGAANVRLAALAVVFWSALGLLFALPQLGTATWHDALLSSLASWWSWGLLTPFILALDRRLPFSITQQPQRLAVYAMLCPLVTLLDAYLVVALSSALDHGSWSSLSSARPLDDEMHGMYLWSMLIFCLIVGVSQAYTFQRRSLSADLRMERLERNFSEARLNSLRMQLDPHFLFNALNTISAQVAREPKLARGMIEHLGDLLRLSLDSHGRQEVSLGEELTFLDHYLAIQKIRFGDALRIGIDVAPEACDAMVPSLFLQPLVENAIRHGIGNRAGGGAIVVTAHRVRNRLDVRVLDDGVGLPPRWTLEGQPGLGLSITRERIASLNPAGASRFDVRNRTEGGTAVEVSFPFRGDAASA